MKIFPIVTLKGTVSAPPSKSYSHRAFLLASFANTPSYILNPMIEGDVKVTIDYCKQMGISIEQVQTFPKKYKQNLNTNDTKFLVERSKSEINEPILIDGENSGTSIRFIASYGTLLQQDTIISGVFFEKKRPIHLLLQSLEKIGGKFDWTPDQTSLTIHPSSICVSSITIDGNISSQFITCLLCISALARKTENQSVMEIHINPPIVSYPYLEITEDCLTSFGVKFEKNFSESGKLNYYIPGDQAYNGTQLKIPGDFSSSAFIIVAAALNPFPDEITILNLDMKSPQGDKVLIILLQKIGVHITIAEEKNQINIRGGEFLTGFEIDCSQIPDLFPILCVLGLFCNIESRLYNLAHIRFKESNRVDIMVRELKRMGAQLIVEENEIIIKGPQQLHGIEINHENDHRIAMALTIAALFARSISTIKNSNIVKDSYTRFFEDLIDLGVKIETD